MSENPERIFEPQGSRSSVSLWTTSKGVRQWRVTVVAGTTNADLDALIDQALDAEKRLSRAAPVVLE